MYAYGGTSGGTKAFADVKGIGSDFGHPAIPNTEVKSKYATTLTDDGYIIETAIALKDNAEFKAGDVMKCALQVNDIYSSEGKKGYALGSQDCYNSGIELTFAEKPDTSASAAATSNTSNTSNASNTSDKDPSPQTSDIGVYAAAAAIGSAACFVFVKHIEKKLKTNSGIIGILSIVKFNNKAKKFKYQILISIRLMQNIFIICVSLFFYVRYVCVETYTSVKTLINLLQ